MKSRSEATAFALIIPKLILLLSSDKDGEVVSAARAIGRVLAGAGLDFHDLANALGAEEMVRCEPETWREVARWCRDNDHGRLTPDERRFVADMANRLVCGGQPSDKQSAWLRAIYTRLRSEGP
jgi:hypothetical protein